MPFPGLARRGLFQADHPEYLADEAFRTRTRKVWKKASSERNNHFLDCRVYNLALAEFLGLSSITPAEWAALARERGMPPADVPALFRPAPAPAPPSPSPPPAAPAKKEETIDEMLERLGKANSERW